jgi:ribonuclease R
MDERILSLLGRKDYAPLNVPELLRRLRLAPNQQQEFQGVLAGLEQAGRIARIKGNRYILPVEADLVPGRLRMSRGGKGFLQPDDPALKEIVVPPQATSTAMNEDRVLVRRDIKARGLRSRGGDENTGTVVRILERRRTQIVGTLQKSEQFMYVVPDDPRMPHDIYVPPPRDVGRPAIVGEKVVVELKYWESRNTNPEGEIIEVLGPPDAEGVDMLSVLRQYDLPLRFPPEVLEQARAIGTEVRAEEVTGRLDCRRHRVVTIDPDDAKDFDDAIYLERAGRDQWRLWVHIADVSHYVKPGTTLDLEARKRGNSTYLVDRVIPMLPEALSTELCSLKPHVDRLTKCVEFLISNDGRVLNSKVYAAAIHSQRRYSYQEVFRILQAKPVDEFDRMLHDANALAQRIRRRRFQAGSLDLDFPERKIRLDEQGRVTRIEKVENDISHQLIEEFMLLANEAVATRLMSRNQPAVYRVHEEPNELRLDEYREEVLSHNVPCGDLKRRPEVQKLLQRLNTLPIGQALKIGFLKSLMRARYSPEPLGHYGLAKQKYTHFTSPIRRYADLIVHRAVFQEGRLSRAALAETADHISNTERNSADAERDSKDVKLFAFLKAQLKSGQPERYAGLVTDVRNFGFFVDVPELTMSGLVPLSTVEDDFYFFDPARNHLVGRRTRRIIRLGDKLTVQVAQVDSFKKQVDFRLAEEPRTAPRSRQEFRGRGRERPGLSPRPVRGGPQQGVQYRPGGRPDYTANRPDRRPSGRSRPREDYRPLRKPEGRPQGRPDQRGEGRGRPGPVGPRDRIDRRPENRPAVGGASRPPQKPDRSGNSRPQARPERPQFQLNRPNRGGGQRRRK